MKNLFGKNRTRTIDFCERCGDVCDSGCRANATREAARLWVLPGWRVA